MSLIPDFKIGMWNAWIFMSVFLLQMLIMMLADKSVREKTHVPQNTKQNNFEKYIGIVGNIIWLLSLIYSVFLPLRPGTAWFIPGLVIFIIGFIFMIISTVNFITTPAKMLITKGLYRLSRHPMYLASFFICLGAAIAAISWVFILLSLIMIACFHQEALIEERYCSEKYREYKDYMKCVPRWIGIPKRIGF